ncbi:hypothetical protein ACTXT7_014613 [Hymenolepis weldensis]
MSQPGRRKIQILVAAAKTYCSSTRTVHASIILRIGQRKSDERNSRRALKKEWIFEMIPRNGGMVAEFKNSTETASIGHPVFIMIFKSSITKLSPENPVFQISKLHHDPKVNFAFNKLFNKYKNVPRIDLTDVLEEKRYADARVRILNRIEQNLDIALRDKNDEYRRIDTFLDNAAVIQQKVG